MNQLSTYTLPSFFDLEQLPVSVKHTILPPFCTFSDDAYIFEPIAHFGSFKVSGYLSDSLNQRTPFSFMVEVLNTPPYFQGDKLSDISLTQS
jgi:hypothetical protein